MMGVGKSSVGRRVALRLGRQFLDTDRLVEDEAGCTVAEIFAGDRTIRVELGPGSYDIVVGTGVLDRAAAALPGRARVAVVSQEPIAGRYAPPLLAALRRAGTVAEVFLMGDGEEAKSLATVE